MRRLTLGLLAVLLLWGSPVSASPFRLDPVDDGLVIGSSLAVNLGALVWERTSGPALRWDEPSWDQGPSFPFSSSADRASKVLALGALSTPLVLGTLSPDEWVPLGVLYAESLSWAWGLKEVGKTLIHRTRPSGEDEESFPSGHTTLAFTMAAFTTFVFDRCFPDSPWTLPLAVGSYTLATGTAVLRVTSGNHFVTDVVAGALIGTLVGTLIPWLHTRQESGAEWSLQMSRGLEVHGTL